MKMASSKTLSSTALFLSLNLIFFSMVTSANVPLPACSIDIRQLSPCAGLLGPGSLPTLPCCSLLSGLVDLEAAVCLCAAIKAGILGIVIDVNLALTLLLNICGKQKPSGFYC